MGKAQHDHEDHPDAHELRDVHDLLPLIEEDEDGESLSHTEQQGVDDADELLLSQLDDHGADLGLDLETGVEGGLDASTLVDADDELSTRDDARSEHVLDDGAVIDSTGAEDGWMKDSEGDAELYQSDFEEDEADGHRDDGGLEGVESTRGKDDPLHDGLDEMALPPLDRDEGDDTLIDEIERELLRELGQGI